MFRKIRNINDLLWNSCFEFSEYPWGKLRERIFLTCPRSTFVREFSLTCPRLTFVREFSLTCPCLTSVGEFSLTCPCLTFVREFSLTCPPSTFVREFSLTCPRLTFNFIKSKSHHRHFSVSFQYFYSSYSCKQLRVSASEEISTRSNINLLFIL